MKALRVVGFALVAALVVACGSGTENEPGEDVVDQDNQADTPAAVCGDGTCNGTETCTTCAQDCGACAPVCGDGTCNGTETCTTCVQDCGACQPGCGDGTCNGTETCTTCTQDCGACAPVCGDGTCNGTETCSTCTQDCGACPPGCGDGTCSGTETCSTCPDDCGACAPVCGDGTCNGDETCTTCEDDCGACPAECGDGTCNGTETCSTCEDDCGTCPCTPACTAGFHCENGTCVPDQVGPCQKSGNVANLKSCAEGAVDVTLSGVTVTYVFGKGYFVQDASAAVEIYVGDPWPYPTPAVGQVIDVHVTSYGNFKNQQEATATDAPVVTGNAPVDPLKLDVSAGTLPSEELESRLIKGTGFTVTSIGGSNLKVSYGTAVDVVFRAEVPGTLCQGAKFDLAAGVITQYENDHRLQSFLAQDIINVNTGGCAVEPVMDDSNWGFEETSQNDPPADFFKVGTGFTAKWTLAQKHAGNNGCELAWTSTDNQDLVAGYYQPVAAGQNVTFTLWVVDNDVSGRCRLALQFFDASKVSLSTEYSTTYSADNPAWTQLTYSFAAPANAAFVRSYVRLYDIAGPWDGDAVIFVDDWAVQVQ